MALNEQEKEIILFGQQNGKTPDQITQAITKYRQEQAKMALAINTAPAPKQTFAQDVATDVQETVGNLTSRLEGRADKIEEASNARKRGEQGLVRTAIQQFGQGAGAASDVIAETVLGAGKVLLPQKAEDKISETFTAGAEKAASVPAVQNIMQKYQQLQETNPALARDIDAALGITGLAAEFVGGGIAKKGVTEAAKRTASISTDAARGVKAATVKGANRVAQGAYDIKSTLLPTKTVEDQALAIVRKPQTKLYQDIASSEGRFTQNANILGKRTITPDRAEKSMADAVLPLVEAKKITPKMNPVQIQKVIDDEARVLNTEVKQKLADPKNNVIFNTKTLDGRLKKLKSTRDILLQSEPSANKAYDAVVSKFKSFIKTNDTKGLFEARQKFDSFMRKNYPGAFKIDASGDLSPVNSAINTAFFDVRNSVNDSIGAALPDYRTLMSRESNLINAADTIGRRELVGTGETNALGRIFKSKSARDKLIKAGILTGTASIAGGLGVAGVNAATGN